MNEDRTPSPARLSIRSRVVDRLTGSLLVAFALLLPAGILLLGSGDRSPWYLLLLVPLGALIWRIGELCLRRWAARIKAWLSGLEERSVQVGHVRGVPILLHWSLAALLLVLLPAAVLWPMGVVVLAGCHVFTMLLHESGHAVVARHERCEVDAILVGAVHGVTRYSIPFRRRSATLIAWGGVAAQAVVALPTCVAWYLSRTSGVDLTNVALVMLGPVNGMFAIINLAPLPGLDGAQAWAFGRAGLLAMPRTPHQPRWWNRR